MNLMASARFSKWIGNHYVEEVLVKIIVVPLVQLRAPLTQADSSTDSAAAVNERRSGNPVGKRVTAVGT